MEYLLAAALALSAAAVTVGAAIVSPAAGWIVGGVLAAGWSMIVFRGSADPAVPDQTPTDDGAEEGTT